MHKNPVKVTKLGIHDGDDDGDDYDGDNDDAPNFWYMHIIMALERYNAKYEHVQ